MDRLPLRILILISFSGFWVGCSSDQKFGTPDVLHPGYIQIQNDKYQQFDPFMRADIGPKIPGDRPNGASHSTPTLQHLKLYEPVKQPPYKWYFVPNKF